MRYLLTGLLSAGLTVSALAQDHSNWAVVGGDDANSKYSSHTQINRDNVGQLTPVWRYASARGKAIAPTSELQVNPIVVDGVLYGRNPLHHAFAIRADTGEQLWHFDPFAEAPGLMGSYMRGVTHWRKGDDQRIFFSASHYLYAVNATDGKLIESFADAGKLDLREHLGRPVEQVSVYSPSPGVVFEDLIIMGSALTEFAGSAPGDIRAYSAMTGELAWRFRTIPHPGEYGYDSWPEGAWKTAGGANNWAGMSLDRERGIVYVPTGSPAPDFEGAGRQGANLFGNTILALDARSGKRLWHFQAVHHDLWDRDLSSAPSLVDLHKDGEIIPALAQASKQGVIYLLDRTTGEPIFPIEEVPVPASDVPGEKAHPTQPRVTLPEPFTRQAFTPDMITRLTPESHAYVKKLYEESQPFAYMRPVGLKPTIIFPGFPGGANWGGAAVDPARGIHYINATETAHRTSIGPVEVSTGEGHGFGEFIYRKTCAGCHGINREGFYPYAPSLQGLAERRTPAEAKAIIVQGKGRMMPFGNLPEHERRALVDYLFNADKPISDTADAGNKRTVYMFNGYADFLDDRGFPANTPPWGTLTATDLNSGKRLWQVPLGEIEALTKEGAPPTGTASYGGPIVTAGGLLFIGATPDEQLRAFDVETGELLWRYKLPAAAHSTPATYMMDGVQYLVVVASGGKLGTPAGDEYIAFALPTVSRGQTP